MGMLSAHKTGTNERLIGLVIQLTEKFCVIQYRSTRKVIGAGEQHEGLYFLKGAASVHAFKMNGAASFKLWHRRMGHPSSKVLGLILEVVYNNKNANKKGWRLYDLEIGEYFVSRDVVFVETDFPFTDKDVTTDDLNVYRTYNWSTGIEVDCDEGELTNADVSAEEGNLDDDDYVTHSIKSGPSVRSPFQSNSLDMNQLHMQKQQKKNVGEMQREKKIKLLRIMGLGPWSIYHMGRKQSEAIEGIDYHETFAPTTKMVTVRTFLVVVAAKNWNLHQMDVQNAFLHGDLDEEVYMKMPPVFASSSSRKMNILVYVDDLIISGTDENSEGLFLCQLKYALDIIFETGSLGAKPAKTPLEQNHKLALATGLVLKDPAPYRRLVGCLIYFTITRPELAYCVHILAHFMQQPKQHHLAATLHVVHYLKVEYQSMTTTTCKLKWLKGLLRSLGVDHFGPMSLYCDSQAALRIAANLVYHERMKHIEVYCHFIRDKINSGNIVTKYVHISIQLADILTKALGTNQFDVLLRKLGILDIHAPT
ncbi:Retrovirus-related Pol polyprotein from transposon RE1 [Vitis vinifera]|uniref:Retrovirus-related Pol polyprotein from transposon RE1 n=1 Tax=Vitis vinifera TaxID=29760 RepID=A0A438H183_VITVI|nr:Retrovirus-related Pol polyprotein from transposon RE1 [Vitis vinifera]